MVFKANSMSNQIFFQMKKMKKIKISALHAISWLFILDEWGGKFVYENSFSLVEASIPYTLTTAVPYYRTKINYPLIYLDY